MSLSPIIELQNIYKSYPRFETPLAQLKSIILSRPPSNPFHALSDISLSVYEGDIVGIIGKNGSGKSTLLQIICGTLNQSSGTSSIHGRIAALLELGAGFNPEFTGRENVYLSAAIMGYSKKKIDSMIDEIINFSGIRDFIDQPVKTYSSGMYVRLAFSVAVTVEPDILVIDEALAVGDGEFSRKSFERVMALKKAGKTILFCTHAMYQIEALCNRVVWLDHGHVKMVGKPKDVVVAYTEFLESSSTVEIASHDTANKTTLNSAVGVTAVDISINGNNTAPFIVLSSEDSLEIKVSLVSPVDLPIPTVAVMINDTSGKPIASNSTQIDNVTLSRNVYGQTSIQCIYPRLSLLKGHYTIEIFLLCEQGIHVYEHLRNVAEFSVQQKHLEMGVVSLPHTWQ